MTSTWYADIMSQTVEPVTVTPPAPKTPARAARRPVRSESIEIKGTRYNVMPWVKGWRLLKAGTTTLYSTWAKDNDPTTKTVVFCDCPSFKFSRGRIEDRKPCKHMEALAAHLNATVEDVAA